MAVCHPPRGADGGVAVTTPTLADLFTTSRILLVCGTGGVGKTTTSVILGLAAARQGRRVLVLTVDPARRLANALGLAAFDHTLHRIWGTPTTGILDGMMLDAKYTFDRVVEQHAPDAASAAKILHNPLYQQLSTTIAGSHEYMAMEQLYELTTTTTYDLIILDTPPTHQALDFFRAPLRMVNALSGSMLKLFLKPAMAAGTWGASLLARGTNTLMRVFGQLTGAALLHEISELLMSTVNLLGGFEDRARAVHAVLRSPETGVVLVTIPQAARIDDARQFLHDATALSLNIRGVIFNRTTPSFGPFPVASSVPTPLQPALDPLYALAMRYTQQRQHEARLQATLLPTDAPPIAVHTIAERAGPLTSVDELMVIANTI